MLIGREPSTPTKLAFFIKASNTTILFDTSSVITSGFVKMALAYSSGDYAAYLNGSLVASGSTSFSFDSALANIAIGPNSGNHISTNSTSNTKQAVVFTTRLTNSELASLTTI